MTFSDCAGLRLVPTGADPLDDVATDGALHVYEDPDEFLLSVHDRGAHLQPSRWSVAELRVARVRDPADLTGALVGEPVGVVSTVPLFQWLVRHGRARYEESQKEERRREAMRARD